MHVKWINTFCDIGKLFHTILMNMFRQLKTPLQLKLSQIISKKTPTDLKKNCVIIFLPLLDFRNIDIPVKSPGDKYL